MLIAGVSNSPFSKPIHPAIFDQVIGWISDTRSPIVTAFSIDAVLENRNQFGYDEVTENDEWVTYSPAEGGSFTRYRIHPTDNPDTHIYEVQTGGGATYRASYRIVGSIQRKFLNGEKTHIFEVLEFGEWDEKQHQTRPRQNFLMPQGSV